MKTTYILAGGYDRKYPEYGLRLAQEIHKRVSQPKILSCFFASEPEDWPQKQIEWRAWFAEWFPGCLWDVAKTETLLSQIQRADVVYLHGGHTQLLMQKLQNHDALQQAWNGKVVVGSSAGSQFLSRRFISASRGVLGDGAGIIDANVMVHYGAPSVEGKVRTAEEWELDKARFQEYIGPQQKITLLPEGEFVTWQEDKDA